MTTNFPGSLDTTVNLKNDAVDATVTSTVHAAHHNNISDAIIAIETELGANPSGSFATVAAAILDAVYKTPGANQMIQPSGNFVPWRVRGHSTQTVNLTEWQNNGGSTLAFVSSAGVINAVSYQQGGSALASTHLTDSALLARLAGPAFSGVPTAPTAAVDTATTQIATTAFVINQAYAKLASPIFTGTPTGTTASVGDNTTRLATTAFVVAEILSRAVTGYGTSLPGSPTNGQEFILVDSLTNPTYQWRFRYNGNSLATHKWEFVGGAAVVARTADQSLSPIPVTYTDLPSAVSITVPVAGVYEVSWGATALAQSGGGTFLVSIKFGSATTSDLDSLGTANSGEIYRSPTLSASDVVKLQWKYNNSSIGTVRQPSIRLIPIRVA